MVYNESKNKLIRILKTAADFIRGSVDYKVLLLFLFYKAISDKWYSKVNKFIKEGYREIDAYILANNYFVLYDEENNKLLTWQEITKNRNTINEMVNALIKISRLNPKVSDLEKLIEVIGLKGFLTDENLHTIEKIVQTFNSLDFSNFSYDIIGDAYMWILNYFAPKIAKEGENYTPIEVVKLLVRILDIKVMDKSVYVLDPAVGSGSMLIETYNYVKKNKEKGIKGEDPDFLMFYGQERNEITGAIAKLNLILHGIKNFEIFIGDSLVNPKFDKSDYCLANPPWNQDYNIEEFSRDPKIKKIYMQFVDTLPPNNSMDWAWVQLMLYYSKKKVGVILDNGALFRRGREEKIRKAIIKNDLIEAIILLPEKLFYNTSAPGVIIIFNKEKPKDRKGKIIFINASKEFVKHPEVKKLNKLDDKNIEKIVKAYKEFKDIENFAKVVNIDEIKKNDYNLNVSLYIAPLEKEEKIDVIKEWEELKKINKESEGLFNEINEYVEKIKKLEL